LADVDISKGTTGVVFGYGYRRGRKARKSDLVPLGAEIGTYEVLKSGDIRVFLKAIPLHGKVLLRKSRALSGPLP
jgi:hypothetical protein